MQTSSSTELEEFHRFVGDQLRQHAESLSPEAALGLFRQQQTTTEELASSAQAVERALAQADRGEGVPLDEAMHRLREKHGLPQCVDEE